MLQKTLTTFLFACICFYASNSQQIPESDIQSIDGGLIQFGKCAEMKVLIVMLPSSSSSADSLNLIQIDSAYKNYGKSIQIIGILAYEDGFSVTMLDYMKNWYRNVIHISFPITTGIYTHNNSINQSPICKWLTDDKLNGHFAISINSSGQKFLLNKNCELKAVLDSETDLTNEIMNLLLEL